MSSPIFRLVYISRVAHSAGAGSLDDTIAHILSVSRRNNARVGVTGALLFSAGVFAQTLEGPVPAVEGTFERIQCDPRHHQVSILQVGYVPDRLFADWSMGHATGAGVDRFAAIAPDMRLSGPRDAAAGEIVALMGRLVREDVAVG